MHPIDLWIAGKPKGKDRPRFANGRTYTPKETENAEANIVSVWREAGEPRLPDDAAIELTVTVCVERPSSHYNSKGEMNAEGKRNPHPARKKPDVDNCLKLVMDALNGRAYKDDVRVVDALVRRVWFNKSGVWVKIREAP